MVSHRSPGPLAREIPDIFIPPTPMGNAGVMRGRNENSGMTTRETIGGGDSFTLSGATASAKNLAAREKE